jgi:Na+-transporting NADH:ubiquinone oxidoreductase subunit F
MESAPGRVGIVVNAGDRLIEAERGRPLLFALMGAGILLPSACGGHASCGQCRVRVTDGAPPPTVEEQRFISPEDTARGIRLACQVPIHEHLRVRIPGQALRARRFVSGVVSIRDVARDLREIRLALSAPEEIRFSAGQYVQLFLPGTDGDAMPVYRAYSISSPPSSRGAITLVIGRVPGGACSTWVFERAAVGDVVAVNGPFGEFSLGAGDRELVFIAGGSGMAPVRGMLLDLEERGDPRPVVFLYSARSPADLPYLEEMQSLEHRLPSFRFIPVLSRPDAEDRWTGERGGIAAAVDRLLPSAGRREAFLCGSPGMIDACIRVLAAKGLALEHIHFDKFS